jgi:hypothetical protein
VLQDIGANPPTLRQRIATINGGHVAAGAFMFAAIVIGSML